ncbi:hypothetical protein GCM10009804_29910 [Kribbella hippodromi]|uniref:Uncharacterized protein n=1 Tax=Kribbella hippodromi TaxID=434347 RepID=A0ABN2D7U4_9ACTN
MSPDNDLRQLLRTMADESTAPVDRAVLVPRIRRQRRRRVVLTGLAGAVAVSAIALGAYAALPGAEPPLAAPATTPTPAPVTKPLPTKNALPTKKPVPPGSGPVCGTVLDKRFPPRLPSGMDGLSVQPAGLRRTTAGWTGSLTFTVSAPTRSDRLEQVVRLGVTRQRELVGFATLTRVTPPEAGGSTVVYRLDIAACAKPIPAGTVMIYGQILPPKSPLTFFTIQL